MADVEVNIKLGYTELKKGIKEAKDAIAKADFGSEAYDKASKSLLHLQEEMKNVTDQAKIQGTGVERLESSFGLLTEGFKTADFGAIKAGFKGLGQAMEAVPIFLLIEGIKELIDNFGEIKEIAKTVFGTFSEGEIAVEKLNRELEHQKEINKELSSGLQNEIKILEAQGASNEKILAKKKELNAIKIRELEIDARLQLAKLKEIQDNDTLIESYYRKGIAILESLGADEKAAQLQKILDKDKLERSKEVTKKIKEDLLSIEDLKTEIKVEEIKVDQDNAKKAKDRAKERRDDANDVVDIERNKQNKLRELEAKKAEQEQAAKDKEQADRDKNLEELKALQLKQDQEEVAAFIEKERQMTEAKKAEGEARYNIEKQGVQTAQIFSDLFFQSQLQAAAGNEAKQIEIKRKAFEVNKAFQASQATIDGVRATLSAYATAPPGFKIAAAVSAGLFAAAQVAKILAAKFNSGVSAASISNIGSGGGSPNGGGAPLGGQIQQVQQQQSTTFNEKGQQTGNWISVQEINSTQKRVAKMSEQARF